MASIALRLLGGFEVTVNRKRVVRIPTRKAQAVLAYLAMAAGRRVPRETLASLLWGSADEPAARNNVRQTLFILRRSLAEAATFLDVDLASVCLSEAVTVDVPAFEREITEKDPGALAAAIARYGGDFLSGLSVDEPAYEEWMLVHRQRLRGMLRDGLARLVAHDARHGNHARALDTARRGLALDPLDEAMHREVMRLHAAAGQPVAALRQYQVCVDTLQRELGVEPDAETRTLYRRLLEDRRASPREEATAALSSDTSLVGRASELERLKEVLHAAALGSGRVVAILGDAGIGKSRLARELAAETERHDGRVVTGACHVAEQTLPLHPWVEAVRRARVLDQLDVRGWPPGWQDEVLRLFPEIDPSRTPGPPGEDSALQLFEGLARLITTLAPARPLLVLLEDVHWADTMSLRFLSFLAHRIERAPVLLALTAREEETVDVPLLGRILGELERERRLTRVVLGPLTRAATDRLVRAHAPAADADAVLAPLRQAVWAASGGNPFIAIEMVQALRHGAPAHGAALPRKVHDLIADRLERLSERAQDLAALAAVMPGDIDFTLLARASGLTEAEAADGLEELVRRRVLHGVDEQFAFVHDRVRDVALQRLLPPRRRLLHRRVAEAAETLYANDRDSHAAVLGMHYRGADAWDRALPYIRTAGAQALAAGAQREAAAWFEQAIEALERLPASPERTAEAIDLRIDLRHALIPLALHDKILAHLEVALRLAAASGDRARQGRVLALLANCHFNCAQYDQSRDTGVQADVIARDLGDRALAATLLMLAGMLCHQTGRWAEGAAHYRRFLSEANEGVVRERVGLSGLTPIYARAYLCICLAELGEFAEGYAVAEEAVRRAHALRHPWALGHACVAMAALATRQGRPDRALACYAWYREALPPTGDVWPLAEAWAAYADVLAGRVEESLPRLDPAGMPPLIVPAVQLWRADACVRLGRLREARVLASEALDTGRRRGEESYVSWAELVLADIAARSASRSGEAEARYAAALAMARTRGMRPLEGLARLGLGRLRARGGRRDAGREDLDAAHALLTELGMTGWLQGPAAWGR